MGEIGGGRAHVLVVGGLPPSREMVGYELKRKVTPDVLEADVDWAADSGRWAPSARL